MVETPAEAFAALGNDVRVEILLALAEESRPGYANQGVRFSEIQERVDLSVTRGGEALRVTFDGEAAIRDVTVDE